MFAFEENGYNKSEVDLYIGKLKAELMEKKLSLLNSEQKVLDLTQKQEEVDNKERRILKAVKALEEAHKIQEEGSKNLSNLKNKQSVILSDKILELIDYLKSAHPELDSDKNALSLISEVEDMAQSAKTSKRTSLTSENDSMRVLLDKMQEYRRKQEDQKQQVKTVKIERNIHHLFEDSNNVDEFLANKPDESQIYKNIDIEANGFDLKEAVNPKIDLDEIMKSFDFFKEGE